MAFVVLMETLCVEHVHMGDCCMSDSDAEIVWPFGFWSESLLGLYVFEVL